MFFIIRDISRIGYSKLICMKKHDGICLATNRRGKKKVYSKDSFKGYLGIGLPSIILNIGSFYTQEAFIRGIP